MRSNKNKNVGMELLIRQYKENFETKENITHNAYRDFVQAERKYLKFMLDGYGYTDANISK